MGQIFIPNYQNRRREICCTLLGISRRTELTDDELEEMCIKRGYFKVTASERQTTLGVKP